MCPALSSSQARAGSIRKCGVFWGHGSAIAQMNHFISFHFSHRAPEAGVVIPHYQNEKTTEEKAVTVPRDKSEKG